MIGFKPVEKTGFFKSVLKWFTPEPPKPKVFCSECKHFRHSNAKHKVFSFQCWLREVDKIVHFDDTSITRAHTTTLYKYSYVDAAEKNNDNHCKDYWPAWENSPKENT